MTNSKLCIFCGEKPSYFQSDPITLAGVTQPCCKSCRKDISQLNNLQILQRSLKLGLANQPEKIEEAIDLLSHSEDHRPICSSCGTPLTFERKLTLDSSPSTKWGSVYEIIPANCPNCHKVEFYSPSILEDKYIEHLYNKDYNESY